MHSDIPKSHPSFSSKLGLMIVFSILFTSVLYTFTLWFTNAISLSLIITLIISIPLCILSLHFFIHPAMQTLQALHNGFLNLNDNDFSIQITQTRHDELGQLIYQFNRVSESLRKERINLYQRELLLDTVIQATPIALILTNNSGNIIYSNTSAKQLFSNGKPLNGAPFRQFIDAMPAAFAHAIDSELGGLFTTPINDTEEILHLTQSHFVLNGHKHRLYLVKSLTREINRQEVNTWKKVIRLLSHELNNSLAPIHSLAHSGQLLTTDDELSRLHTIFSTIEERASHLHLFLEGYATFARLPKPKHESIELRNFIKTLQSIKPFNAQFKAPLVSLMADPVQLEQALINLLKNAHESGSPADKIQMTIQCDEKLAYFNLMDEGKGMSDNELSQALLPFFSTKSQGSGLGLPLCREIIEAHGGRLVIANRESSGLKISIMLPNNINKQQS